MNWGFFPVWAVLTDLFVLPINKDLVILSSAEEKQDTWNLTVSTLMSRQGCSSFGQISEHFLPPSLK